MSHLDLRKTVRAYARDFNGTIFRQEDITRFLNEAIDRLIQVFPVLNRMAYLVADTDYVVILPKEYHHLLSTYAVARLFSQDERHYQATTYMNEFEIKLSELKEKYENGEVIFTDPDTGSRIEQDNPVDYVANTYFSNRRGLYDADYGIDGVE